MGFWLVVLYSRRREWKEVRLSLRAPKTNPRISYDWKTFAADSEMQEKYTVEVCKDLSIKRCVKAPSSSKHPDIMQAREQMD
jgi:hypothetical protein